MPLSEPRFRIVDYYPADAGWAYMWQNWQPSVIAHDFRRIAALHANVVRIIIQATAFGYPTPTPVMLHRLSQIVSMANGHGLQVEISLFDWWHQYDDVDGSKTWARAILQPLHDDRRIAFVEVQNEIDPTNPAAMAWARQMIPYIRSIAGRIPISISVPASGGVTLLGKLIQALRPAPPDLYDLHYYGPPALAYTAFTQARALAGRTPVINAETGYSTRAGDTRVAGLGTNLPAQEFYQDEYYRTVEYAARAAGLRGIGAWTLNDFTPHAIPSGKTAGDPVQYGFGLYRDNGSAKPAAATLSSIFAMQPIDTSFNNGFEVGTDGLPAGWLLSHGHDATFTRDTTVSHSGRASARISRSGGDGSGVPAFFISPIAPIAPRHVYRLSVWARGQHATGENRIALAWFDAQGSYLGQAESTLLPAGTTGWTPLSVTASAPAGAVTVQIHLKSSHNAGAVWFDDVRFQDGGER